MRGRSRRRTTESTNRIDIRSFKRDGCLYPGSAGVLSWSRGSEKPGSIRYRVEADRMILTYRHKSLNSEWQPVEQTIRLDQTPCRFGGYRKWFRCPGCGRRVVALYGAGVRFLCRHCYGLNYGSQHESRPYRLLRKMRNIRQRLGDHGSVNGNFPDKPKHMHWQTYQRLRNQAEAVENSFFERFRKRYRKVFG